MAGEVLRTCFHPNPIFGWSTWQSACRVSSVCFQLNITYIILLGSGNYVHTCKIMQIADRTACDPCARHTNLSLHQWWFWLSACYLLLGKCWDESGQVLGIRGWSKGILCDFLIFYDAWTVRWFDSAFFVYLHHTNSECICRWESQAQWHGNSIEQIEQHYKMF